MTEAEMLCESGISDALLTDLAAGSQRAKLMALYSHSLQ